MGFGGNGSSGSVGSSTDVALNNPSNGQVLTYDSSLGKWKNAVVPAALVTSVAGRTGAVVLGQSDISGLSTSLVNLAPLASPTFTGTVTVPSPSATTDAVTKGYVDSAVTSFTVPDASSSIKGKIQLSGDLAGTASAPTVPALAGKASDTLVVHNTGAETIAGIKTFSSSPVVPQTPTTPTQAASKGYVDTQVSTVSSTSNATSTTPGVIQLANDLGGTATNPQVNSTHLSAALPINQGGTGSTSQNFVDVLTTQTVGGIKTFTSTIVGSVSGNAATVTTNANLTGPVTSSGNATSITAGAVTMAAIADNNVTEPKLAVSNSPSSGQFLGWNGSAMTWGAPAASVDYTSLPAGSTLTVQKSGSTWPARPTSRSDITVQWKGSDPSPSIVSSGTGGMLDNVDVRFVTP